MRSIKWQISKTGEKQPPISEILYAGFMRQNRLSNADFPHKNRVSASGINNGKALIWLTPATGKMQRVPQEKSAMIKSILLFYFKNVRDKWYNEWKNRSFRRRLFFTALGMVLLVYGFSHFLDYIEGRPGVVIADPLLQTFAPIDVTWLTFLVIYISVIIALLFLALEPRRLLVAMQAYMLMVVARALSMYFVPLDPSPQLIPLTDPFVESLSSGTLTRDLFFSGHTSTLFLLFLTANSRPLRVFFLIGTVIVGICVILQHVHYTFDVVAAPFYSYTCYRLSILLNRRVKIKETLKP